MSRRNKKNFIDDASQMFCYYYFFFDVVFSFLSLTEALQENSTINNSTSVAFVRELHFTGIVQLTYFSIDNFNVYNSINFEEKRCKWLFVQVG